MRNKRRRATPALPKKRGEGKFQTPGVVFQPDAYQGIRKGVDAIVEAIRPTLGPFPRHVAISRQEADKAPEILDSGGIIARRIIQIPDRDQDMGAMFTRHMLWKLHERTGDGTVTAGVIFQEIYNQGLRYIAAGGNPMRLRSHLEDGLREILDELDRMTAPIKGKASLIHLAETICHDPELARYLGEIFDVIGEYGRLEIRRGNGRNISRDYIEGTYWEEGLLSRQMITDVENGRSVLENGAVLMTDLDVQEPGDILYLLELAVKAKMTGVLLLVGSLSDRAMSLLLNTINWEKIKVLVVKVPGPGVENQTACLTDLAVLTGGRPLLKATQSSLKGARLDDFGYARRVWAYKDSFGVTGGRGDPRLFRQHIRGLQEAYRREQEQAQRAKLQMRIGMLMGGSATLWIGVLTDREYNLRKEWAERTARALRAALMEGVLPGGGAALLHCKPLLAQRMAQAADSDERAASLILSRALEAPFRAILSNSGYNPGEALVGLDYVSPGFSFDVRTGQVVRADEAGLLDVALVVKEAVRSAVTSAALLLTTDVLVHLKNPPTGLQT